MIRAEPGPDLRQPSAEQLQQATADLEGLRDLFERAGRGDVSTGAVTDALQRYWHEHGPVLRATARALSEQVRAQALAELHEWRAQLGVQLDR